MSVWKQKFERMPEDGGDKVARWVVIAIVIVIAIAGVINHFA